MKQQASRDFGHIWDIQGSVSAFGRDRSSRRLTGFRLYLLYTKERRCYMVVFTAGHSRSHDAVIRVYDEAGNVIETHEQAGEFKEW